jgi:hypothetical protein
LEFHATIQQQSAVAERKVVPRSADRTESSAIAAMRQCRSASAAAALRGTVSIATTVIPTSFPRPAPHDAGECGQPEFT